MTTHRNIAATPQERADRLIKAALGDVSEVGYLRGIVRLLCNEIAEFHFVDCDMGQFSAQFQLEDGPEATAIFDDNGEDIALVGVIVNGADIRESINAHAEGLAYEAGERFIEKQREEAAA